MQKQLVGKICIILCVLSFILSVAFNYKKFDVPYFQGVFMPVAVNIEIPAKYQKDFQVNSQDFNSPASQADYVIISKVLDEEVNHLCIVGTNSEALQNILYLDIFVGRKLYHFNQEDIKSSLKDNSLTLDIQNFKGVLNFLVISFLALFYNIKFFILTWIFLIIGILQQKDNFKFKETNILGIIFTIGLLCRINMLTTYPLWWDEIYIAKPEINPALPKCLRLFFSDPANPPFFYIISQAYIKLLGSSTEALRTLPFIFGSLGIWSIYLLTKKVSASNSALLASFIASISIYHICYTQEVRCYSFILFLSPLLILSLFKLLENFNIKNSCYYVISSAILINTHLFGVLFMVSNFIYGIIEQLKNKQTLLRILAFVGCNLIAFLTLVPYLYFTFINTFNDKTMNPHLEPTSLALIYNIISNNFGTFTLFCIFILFSIVYFLQNKKDSLEKRFLKYGLFTITCFYSFAISLSFIRPLLMDRYFILVYPLYISLFAIIVCNLYRNNRRIIIRLFILLITIIMVSAQNTNNAWKIKESYENIVDYTNAITLNKTNANSTINLFILPERYRLYFNTFRDIELNTDLFPNTDSYYITKASAKFYVLEEYSKGHYQVISTSFKPCRIIKFQH